MSDELFRNKYRIPSVRATWHDYNGGMYFITICTKDREHYFGEIVDGEMRLTAVGAYVQQCIGEIPEHNVYAYVPLFVVMPNHIHMVVIIDDNLNNTAICRYYIIYQIFFNIFFNIFIYNMLYSRFF